MAITERIVTSADGTKIIAESTGDSSKPAIVFVHGLSCTSLGWDCQFTDPDLLRDFYLVRYDMRGHGRSDKPKEPQRYESIRFAEDFKAVCDAFGVNKPFLAGWSLGSSVVVDVVAAYGSSFLSGALYVGGGVLSLQKYHPQCFTPFIAGMMSFLASTDPDDVSRAAEMFVDSLTAPGEQLSYHQKLEWMGGFVAQPNSVRALSVTRIQPYEVWEQQARSLPVLIVQGTEDQHCLYENMIRLAKEVYENVEVKLLDGVGHSPAVERPVATNRYIREWTYKIAAKQASGPLSSC
ncbi:alpha/beta-hydrolase [Pilatotrama ljubarskyi]|nr:alpha/beta-hydrolase [Pilatotrama ljubarskyi]